jgi:Cu-Zn family superoxide dismutase
MSFTTAVAVINSEAVVGTVVATNLNTTLTEKPRRGVNITATFTRLPEGKHGFHIHKAGDLSGKGCAGLCEHFDISNSTHGGTPGSGQRHTGDLGNIEIKEGFDQVTRRYFIEGISIEDLWGRSIVVHAGEDDLGKGGHDDSKITGHSGARIGCAVFGRGYRPERARSRSKSRPSK